MELLPQEQMAELIRKKRKSLDLEQQKLAQLTDLSPSQVNRIEKNKVNPSYQAVYKLWSKMEEMQKDDEKTAKDLMNSPITFIHASNKLEKAAKIMKNNSFSQLPVKDDGEMNVGKITESKIVEVRRPYIGVREEMESPFMEVREGTREGTIREILKDESAVLVKNQEGYQGIITKTDLI